MATEVSKARYGAACIDGTHTDIVIKEYQDRHFIMISQYEKMGTLVEVERDVALEDTRGEPVYTTKVLMGKDEVEHHVIARNLAGQLKSQVPLLFALALKDTSPKTLRGLSRLLKEC